MQFQVASRKGAAFGALKCVNAARASQNLFLLLLVTNILTISSSGVGLRQRLIKIPQDVIDIFNADRQADHVGRDTGLELLFLG